MILKNIFINEFYTEEIIDKGKKTLENFLLLLKEDIILFKNREEKRINKFSVQKAELLSEKFKKCYFNLKAKNKEIEK